MNQETTELAAARQLLAALEQYESKFPSLIAADMGGPVYDELNALLGEIRSAKLVLFNRIVGESGEFLLAHSSLMAALWDHQLAKFRGHGRQPSGNLEELSRQHGQAIERLRGACERIVERLDRGQNKPPAAPSAGF